jgi:hypothetical protein
VLDAIDKDKDGVVSPAELAAFLSSDSVKDVKLKGIEAYGVRAAMLARFASRAGTELMRRVSSDMSTPTGISKNCFVADAELGIGEVPADAPLRLQSTFCAASHAPAPPAELTSGKGLAIYFKEHADGSASEAADRFNELLLTDSPPLPEGVTLSAQAVDLDGTRCFGLFFDAPIADVPPELAAMFGLEDLDIAVADLNIHTDFTGSKSITDFAEEAGPVLDNLGLNVHSRIALPHHIWQVATQIVTTMSAMGMLPEKAAPLAAIIPLYSLLYRSIKVYNFKAHVESFDEVFETAGEVMSAVPGAPEGLLDMVRAFSLAGMKEGLVGKVRKEISRNPDETARAAVVAVIKACGSLRAIRAYVGPVAFNVDAHGFDIPVLREAISVDEEAM